MAKQHVRPRVRSKTSSTGASTTAPAVPLLNDVDACAKTLDQWIGLNDKTERKVSSSELMYPTTQSTLLVEEENEDRSKLFSSHPQTSVKSSTSQTDHSSDTIEKVSNQKLKGILKKPKYSDSAASTPPQHSTIQIMSTLETQNVETSPSGAQHHRQVKKKSSVFKQERIQERDPRQQRTTGRTNNDTAFPTSDHYVVNLHASMSVEGYAPLLDRKRQQQATRREKEIIGIKNNKNSDKQLQKRVLDSTNKPENQEEEEGPLVFNSLADMMEAAGNLPSQDLTDNPQVVEANLTFSCLSPEDYQDGLILQGMDQQQQQEEESDKREKHDTTKNVNRKDVTFDEETTTGETEWKAQGPPLSRTNVEDSCILDGYTGNNPVSDEEYGSNDEDESVDDDGGGGIFDFMGGRDDSEAEEPLVQPRAFRILWECLSSLITHNACVFLRHLERDTAVNGANSYLITATPSSDLAASRSTGFMTMIRMYISRCLNELGQPEDLRRTAEQRLQGLVLTLDFSRPAAKLDTKHWKALTCILLEIVLFLGPKKDEANEDRDGGSACHPLPPSIQAVGMAVDEYSYMVKSTIKTFDISDPVI